MKYLKVIYYLLIIIISFHCSKDDRILIDLNNDEITEIKGADISYLPEVRASGLVFTNSENQPEDMLSTLKNAGANVVRLRLWKQPSEPNSGFTIVKNLAAEIKGSGLKVMLTVHYSDSWADPAKQTKPAQWQGISFNQLLDSVYAYTKKIITEINPDYIQIGNEINSGLLWPDANISNISQMKQVLQAGISSVRETNTSTKIIIHYAGIENADWFFSNISELDYDLIGISYYPIWHGKNLDSLKQSLTSISNDQNKPVFIAETSYPFTLGWNDWTHNIVGLESQLLPQFPATPLGQKEFLSKIKEIISEVPRGIGFCYWGAEWVSYKGSTATDGSSWENQAFWDFENKSLPVLEVYK